jgi:hypothetical protein
VTNFKIHPEICLSCKERIEEKIIFTKSNEVTVKIKRTKLKSLSKKKLKICEVEKLKLESNYYSR